NVIAKHPLAADSFAPRVDLAAPGWVQGIVVADWNDDGKRDIGCVTEQPFVEGHPSYLCIYENLGAPGSFSAASVGPRLDFPALWNAWGLSTVDLDDDGHLDCLF